MKTNFTQIDVIQLALVIGGAGTMEKIGEDLGGSFGATVGGYLGTAAGFPGTGAVIGNRIGPTVGKYLGRGADLYGESAANSAMAGFNPSY